MQHLQKIIVGLLFITHAYGQSGSRQGPPKEAFSSCQGKNQSDSCSFQAPHGTVSGLCKNMRSNFVCVPQRGREQNNNSQQMLTKQSSNSSKTLMDVHGAGAQRSDPKSGDPKMYPTGRGPQGDVINIYNYARCVRETSIQESKYTIVDTNQSSCYSNSKEITCPSSGQNFYGQDANVKGISPSYSDNKNQTISDNRTGLMWQKNFKKISWNNSFNDAKRDRTGGYSDWRVPTVKELYSLMNFNGATGTGGAMSSTAPSNAVPYLDSNVFNFEYATTGRYIDAQYITSTSYVNKVMNTQEAFFGVNFADGRIKGYPKAGNMRRSTFYVRYVRSNTSYGKNNFEEQKDNTIRDHNTGLEWTKLDSAKGLNWQQALAYCQDLNYSNKSDWRLPDAKELHSIVDYSRSPDTNGSAAINPIFQTTAITNAGGNKDFPHFWTSTTHKDGRSIGAQGVYFTFGRALGYMSSGRRR